MASMPVRAGQPARAPVDLPAPFDWVGEHSGCSLPGGRVLFTTRRGGVSAAPYDTARSSAAELFFSHRRDGAMTGRQAGVVWRES